MIKYASTGLKEALLGFVPVEPDDDEQAEGSVPGTSHAPTLHRLAFDAAAVPALRDALSRASPADFAARDPQGNTPLHVAVLARNYDAITALLAAGVSTELRSVRKWTPLDEAIAIKDAKSVKMLLEKLRADVKRERKARKPRLVAAMGPIPDFFIEMRWRLVSPLFGLLLKRYAPDDTYLMWKWGLRLRIDGTLRGLDPSSRSVLPKWRRGPFSLLVDASTTPVFAALVDHTDATWVDLYAERKAAVRDVDQDVADIVAAGAGRVRLKAGAVQFAPRQGWRGGPVTETVEGCSCQVFEASGRLVASVIQKNPIEISPGSTFDDYLEMKMPEDACEDVPWDPLQSPPPSVASTFAGDAEAAAEVRVAAAGGSQAAAAAETEAREVHGRVWMARNHPLTLRQLLPLLEATGGANKHIAAAATFIDQFRDHSLFPVKIKVPLVWTVSMLLKFRRYRELRAGRGEPAVDDPAFFEIPRDYKRVAIIEEEVTEPEETFYEAEEG